MLAWLSQCYVHPGETLRRLDKSPFICLALMIPCLIYLVDLNNKVSNLTESCKNLTAIAERLVHGDLFDLLFPKQQQRASTSTSTSTSSTSTTPPTAAIYVVT